MQDRLLFIDTETGEHAGHNVHFDAAFLKAFFSANNKDFSQYFSHRMIDTSSILYYLYLAGKIKQKAISSGQCEKDFFCNFINNS